MAHLVRHRGQVPAGSALGPPSMEGRIGPRTIYWPTCHSPFPTPVRTRSGPNSAPQWIAIDDMLLHGLRAHLVHTDARVGLTMEQAERAVEMLHASNHMTQCTRSHLCSFCLAWEAEELQATGNARLCHASPSAKPVALKGSSQDAMGDGTTPTPSPLPGTKGLFGKADHVGTPPKQNRSPICRRDQTPGRLRNRDRTPLAPRQARPAQR